MPRAADAALAPDVSDSESSLCESELELEMASGDGPIAPLRTEAHRAVDDAGAIEKSTGAGGLQRPCSSRDGGRGALTPTRRSGEAARAGGAKRLMNVHPMRSAGYLMHPNELPLGARKQQRWLNGARERERERVGGRVADVYCYCCCCCCCCGLYGDRSSLWEPRGVDAIGRFDGAHEH